MNPRRQYDLALVVSGECDMVHPTEDGQSKEIHLTRGEFIVVIYNPSSRVPGPISSDDPEAVEKAIAIITFGAFLAAQQAAKRMEPKRRGAIFFTGASAGMKGLAQSAAFAMGKFGAARARSERCKRAGPEGNTRRALQHRRRRPLIAPT